MRRISHFLWDSRALAPWTRAFGPNRSNLCLACCSCQALFDGACSMSITALGYSVRPLYCVVCAMVTANICLTEAYVSCDIEMILRKHTRGHLTSFHCSLTHALGCCMSALEQQQPACTGNFKNQPALCYLHNLHCSSGLLIST